MSNNKEYVTDYIIVNIKPKFFKMLDLAREKGIVTKASDCKVVISTNHQQSLKCLCNVSTPELIGLLNVDKALVTTNAKEPESDDIIITIERSNSIAQELSKLIKDKKLVQCPKCELHHPLVLNYNNMCDKCCDDIVDIAEEEAHINHPLREEAIKMAPKILEAYLAQKDLV